MKALLGGGMSEVKEWTGATDAQWRQALYQVSLVAELDVDDDDLEQAKRYLGAYLRKNDAEVVARTYPALLVVALTAIGQTEWREGTFYRFVAEALGVPESKAETATRWYSEALRKFSLTTFEEAGGYTWVTPVLLHGAIPLDHLDELLVLLRRRRAQDASLDGDSFVAWARQGRAALAGQPMTLRRFLLHGGDFAADYVQRVSDFMAGEPTTLPRAVRERLRLLADEGYTLTPQRREARPSVQLQPDGDVVLRLPPVVPARGRSVTWEVLIDQRREAVTVEVSYQPGQTRTEGALVSLAGPARSLSVGHDGLTASMAFVRSEDPLLVFDDRGEFVPASSPCPEGPVALLWPTGSTAGPLGGGGAPLTGHAIELGYGWEGWAGLETSLKGIQRISFGGRERRVRSLRRAALDEGPPVPGARTVGGLPVARERPRLLLPEGADPLAWRITISDEDGSVLASFAPDSLALDPLASLPSPVCGTFEVAVQGPLGKGLRRRIALAEGLEINCEPAHRPLAPGGLVPARALVRPAGGEALDLEFPAGQPRALVTVAEAMTLVVEPPHVSIAWLRGTESPTWTIHPKRFSPEEVSTLLLAVKGLPEGQSPWLVLETSISTQQVDKSGARSGTVFPLAALTDHAQRAGSGSLWLVAPGEQFRVGQLRPAKLARAVAWGDGGIEISREDSASLEAVVHRKGAPWEPGRVLVVQDDRLEVPPDLTHGGPLRVRLRVPDEWVPEPAGDYPQPGPDVWDLADVPWDPEREDPAFAPLVGAILDPDPDPAADVDLSALSDDARAEVLRLLGTLEGKALRPRLLASLGRSLRLSGAKALGAVLVSGLDARQITVALVASQLVAAPSDDLASAELVEPLLAHSALAAALAAPGARAAEPSREGSPWESLADELCPLEGASDGEWSADEPLERTTNELRRLGLGEIREDEARVGRFEPAFQESPGMVRVWADMLGAVPRSPLDVDTRTLASVDLWEARHALADEAQGAMGTIGLTRRILEAEAPALLPLLMARLTRDGVLALPVLCISLALLARLAAHGSASAKELYEARAWQHRSLSRHAPTLTAIDLIRADAAVRGVNR